MKNTKFRVRHERNKELIGYERVNNSGQWEHRREKRPEDHWLLGNITDGQGHVEAVREQYIGLKDREGIEIYENDLVKVKLPDSPWETGPTITGVVEYDTPGARFHISEIRNGESDWDFHWFNEDNHVTVCGYMLMIRN